MTDPNETAGLVNEIARGYRDHQAAAAASSATGDGRFMAPAVQALRDAHDGWIMRCDTIRQSEEIRLGIEAGADDARLYEPGKPYGVALDLANEIRQLAAQAEAIMRRMDEISAK